MMHMGLSLLTVALKTVLTRLFISSSRHNTDLMMHMGLSLLTVALETGSEHISHFSALMSLVKDEMCKNVFAVSKKAISVASEFSQDGGSVCCCYDKHVRVRLQECMVLCVLRVISCVMSGACYAEREYIQNGGRGKKADSLYREIVCQMYLRLGEFQSDIP